MVVFAAVAAGGSHIHIHLRRAGGLAWAWAGSFAVGGIGRTADAVFWMRNRADFMAFSRDAGEKAHSQFSRSGLGLRASKCLSRNSRKAGWRE